MDTSPSTPVAPEELVRAGPADAFTAATLRDELDGWLCRAGGLAPQQRADIVVGVYEALANCADHAYAQGSQVGTMTLRAAYDFAAQAICVSVADRGSWCGAAARHAYGARGRGIALMRAVADQCTISGGPHGTVVRLRFGETARQSSVIGSDGWNVLQG